MLAPRPLEVISPFKPTGDQPAAIDQLTRDIRSGSPAVCLLGATGTGKTFTMAHTIARLQKPTLIISHNKTLAAQLFEELREFFPHNSVNYFVSYYDFYQPEAYIPQRDIYIEKDSSRNDDLDQLRLAATSNILSRRDTVVVASVSCIFGLGSPVAYGQRVLTITRGARIDRREFLLALNTMQYQRSDIEFKRSQYRVRGDALEIWPSHEKYAVRVELFGDEVDKIELINPTSGEVLSETRQFFLFPAVHYMMPEEELTATIAKIRADLDARVLELRSQGKLLEAQRLMARTKYDLEMIEEVGFCNGIENYSRYFDGRMPGERPYTLMDYFDFAPPAAPSDSIPPTPPRGTGVPPVSTHSPSSASPSPLSTQSLTENGFRGYRTAGLESPASNTARPNFRDWLLIIDESHVTIPQIRAMFNGDKARKTVLVEHGFRLPAALDNRPLRFEEFESVVPQVMFVSATPGPYELERCKGVVAEQVIRPTGLLDPVVEIKPAQGQVPDLVERCIDRAKRGERVLVTALTKRLCENLASFLDEKGLKVRYLHSEIETLDRVQILADLRQGDFDVLVGVNLLREGLDLPEVSLVCILDADKEGFLRSTTSLIQQMGRAARNANSLVIMYADKMTPSMQAAIGETERRRVKQIAYNTANGITPTTIQKAIRRGMEIELRGRKAARELLGVKEEAFEIVEMIRTLEGEMIEAAEALQFEKAAALRDQVMKLKKLRAESAKSGSDEPMKVRRSELETPRRGNDKKKGRAGMPGVRPERKSKKKPRSPE